MNDRSVAFVALLSLILSLLTFIYTTWYLPALVHTLDRLATVLDKLEN